MAIASRVGAAGRNCGDLDATHQPALRYQISAHLARADNADADGATGVGTRLQIAGDAGEMNICEGDGS
jgi:hypothetical protein